MTRSEWHPPRWAGPLLALAVVLVAGLLAGAVAQAQATTGAGTITLTTQPEAGAIIPDEMESPTKFVIEARGPQGPLRNALIDVEITAPTFGPLASSDIPAIEGTTLLKSRFAAPEGRLEFDYVVPIRGRYAVKLQALPGPGASFQPITRELDFTVNERPSEIVNFWMLMAALAVVGVGVGFVLGYFNRGARAARG
jgi:hypothetical protein